MEESVRHTSEDTNVYDALQEEAAAKEAAAFDLNGPALAFVGDAVYGLLAREHCVSAAGSHRADKLHRHSGELVNAAAQSAAVAVLEKHFTERENAVFHRGRNAKTLTAARHQSIADYRRATGLEAVFGYLFLSGQEARMRALFELVLNAKENTTEKEDPAI